MEFRAYGGHEKLLSPKQRFNIFHSWKGVFTQDQVKLQGLDGQTDETNAHQAHFKEAVQ